MMKRFSNRDIVKLWGKWGDALGSRVQGTAKWVEK